VAGSAEVAVAAEVELRVLVAAVAADQALVWPQQVWSKLRY
jgi:hypothetical protein